MVTCTAIAPGILRLLPGRGHFFAENGVHLQINKFAPFENSLPRTTLVLHANLAKNVSRSFVALEVSGEDAVEIELLESVADNGARRLRSVAVAPERNANPIAEFGALMLHVGGEPHPAAQTAVRAH